MKAAITKYCRLGQSEKSKPIQEVESEDDNDEEHIKHTIHQYTVSENFICSQCNFSFSTQDNLAIHMKNDHAELEINDMKQRLGDLIEPTNKTDVPQFEVVLSSPHEGVSHKMGDRKFKCKGCHYITSSHDHIRLHIKSVHEKNQEKKLKCDKCGYASVDKLRLKVHMQNAHGLGEENARSYKCGHCPYTSPNNAHLKRHVKAVHEKIRNHVCEECGYAASQLSNLNRHKYRQHKM